MASSPTDIELVGQYLDGDSAAFDQLFRRYHARIRAACMRQLGDEAAAEDVVQETFYNVVRSLSRVDASFNFGAWIHRIAANACNDELRRRQRRAIRQQRGGADQVEELILQLPDRDATGHPEAALETETLRRLVWEVGKRLPARQRMVLALRELQGLSYARIARVMGISESAVETLLHRARRRFREEFLLLESPEEQDGICARIDKLITKVGRDKLQASQRAMVDEHLATCAWCAAQFRTDVDVEETVGRAGSQERTPAR